eukprot:472402_1
MFSSLFLLLPYVWSIAYSTEVTISRSSQQTAIVETVSNIMTELQTTKTFIEISTELLQIFEDNKGSYSTIGVVLADVRLLLIELNDEMINIFESPFAIAGYKPTQTRLETNPFAQQKWNNINALIHSTMSHAEELLTIRDAFVSMAKNVLITLLSVDSNGEVVNEATEISINAIKHLRNVTKLFRELQQQTETNIKQNTIDSLQFLNQVLYDLPGSVAFNGLLTQCLQCSKLHTSLTKEYNQHIKVYNNEIENNFNPTTERMNAKGKVLTSVRDKYEKGYETAKQQNNYKNANYYVELFNAENEKVKQHNIEFENHSAQLKRFKDKYDAIFNRLKIEKDAQLECYQRTLEEMTEAGKKLEIDVLVRDEENDTDTISQKVKYVIEHLEQMRSETVDLTQKGLLFKELLTALGDIIIRNTEDEIQDQQLSHYLDRQTVNLGHLIPAFNDANIQTLSQFKDSFCETISIPIEETEQKRFIKLNENIDKIVKTTLNFTEKRKLKQLCRMN